MKKTFLYLLAAVCVACDTTKAQDTENALPVTSVSTPIIELSYVKDSSTTLPESKLVEVGDEFEETATYYVVVADTGTNYFALKEKMFTLHDAASIAIDTLGRTYYQSKDLIALPDDDEDEVYAGDYYPRRFPSQTLSLEYLALYQKRATEKTIALVTGIFERKSSADSAYAVISQLNRNAFVVKTEMYIGCIH